MSCTQMSMIYKKEWGQLLTNTLTFTLPTQYLLKEFNQRI